MEKRMMKAVIWNGKPDYKGLYYGDFPVPEHDKDWVLIYNNACGICGSDLHFFSGVLDGKFPVKNLPAIFGHESAGTVVEADPSSGFKKGDRVAVEAIHSCVNFGGSCERCRSGQFHMCDEGMTHIGLPYVRMLPGGYGDYSAVHKDKLRKLPDSVQMDEAALLDILVVTVHAVTVGNPKLGDSCAVIGCGVVGLCMIQTLKARGIANVVAICKYPFQAEAAIKCGASSAVLYDKDTIASEVLASNGGNGIDQVYECAGGDTGAMNEAFGFMAKKGQIIMMGLFPDKHLVDLEKMLMKEINLLSSSSYSMSGYKDEFNIAIEMLANKQVDLCQLITHRYKPENFAEAIDAARSKRQSKAVKILFERD